MLMFCFCVPRKILNPRRGAPTQNKNAKEISRMQLLSPSINESQRISNEMNETKPYRCLNGRNENDERREGSHSQSCREYKKRIPSKGIERKVKMAKYLCDRIAEKKSERQRMVVFVGFLSFEGDRR